MSSNFFLSSVLADFSAEADFHALADVFYAERRAREIPGGEFDVNLGEKVLQKKNNVGHFLHSSEFSHITLISEDYL